MHIRSGPLNVTVFAFVMLTGWLVITRLRKDPEISWPLVYYAILIALANSVDGLFNLNAVYAGVIAALMLRFEFMNKTFTNVVKTVEIVLLAYFAQRGLNLVMY